MLRSILPVFVFIFSFQFLFSQQSEIRIIPQNSIDLSSKKIVRNLVSSGLENLEIRTNFSEESLALGAFFDPVRYMGIEQGMILSTGAVFELTGDNTQDNYTSLAIKGDTAGSSLVLSNKVLEGAPDSLITSKGEIFSEDFCQENSGDEDLSKAIQGLITYDARVIEIKFIPTADTFYYRYVFASEEYDEYVCSQFNDVFAFYITDEAGNKINTAIIPNKNLPVSINTINAGNPERPDCPASNTYLYQKNNGEQNLIFDGFTKVLDIRYKVIPYKKYTIKIAIADASDCNWDSAVLIENNSIFTYFKSFEINFANNSAIPLYTEKLDEVMALINEHPNSKIQLIGHSDRVGNIDYNYDLSVDRVHAIRELLKFKGIEPKRIFETYKGESMPRYENNARNRRVEIFILGQ